jgi:hypothetical protein
MPPVSIKRFEKLFFASLGLTLLATVLSNEPLQQQAIADDSGLGPVFDFLFTLAINLLFWFFIARRASNVAKWILVGFTVLGVVMLPWIYEDFTGIGLTYTLLNGLSFLLSLASTAMLFTRESVEWLKSKGAVTPVDPDVFS